MNAQRLGRPVFGTIRKSLSSSTRFLVVWRETAPARPSLRTTIVIIDPISKIRFYLSVERIRCLLLTCTYTYLREKAEIEYALRVRTKALFVHVCETLLNRSPKSEHLNAVVLEALFDVMNTVLSNFLRTGIELLFI